MTYLVTAAAVQVQVGGRVHMVFNGQALPEGVEDNHLDALTRKGLIEFVESDDVETDESEASDETEPDDVETDESETEIPEGEPSNDWTVKQIDAYATELGIDLGGSKTKADKLAALAAASA